MVLSDLALTDFRNHAATRLEGTAQFNLLVGENGAGKTNILEAISLLSPGRGLRRAVLTDIARSGGQSSFAVSAQLAVRGGKAPIRIGTGTTPDKPNRRQVRINGASASALALGEWLAVFWLTPAMDGIFTDSAGARRRFLDRMAVAIDPEHARYASRYEAALRERNRLLSDPKTPDPQWFDGIEAQMAETGAGLVRGRITLLRSLATALETLPDEPFAKPDLAYRAGGALQAAQLQDSWRQGRNEDRRAGRTLTGPHRDELEVTMAGKDTPAAKCSTGEQKAMLIAITLAHAELASGLRPGVMLLDEVAAHLDPIRRDALYARLRSSGAQVWMTGTELAPFEGIADEAAVWRVSGGTIERVT